SFAHAPAGLNSDAGPSTAAKAIGFLDRNRMKAFAVLLLFHVWGAAIAIRTDWIEPFSMGRAAAEWLDRNIPDKDSVVFVGSRSPVAATVVGYLQLDHMYYPDRSEYGSYVLYDKQRLRRRPHFGSEV